jgi:xeroderma pigmentosum group C-complementing protein
MFGDIQSSIFDDCEILIDKLDFQRVARKLEGSRDVGAQLFCALLRCAGVETRLLCSLQVLPFTNSAIGTRPATSTQGFAPGRPDLESPASDNSQKETKPFEASNVTPGIQSSLSSRFRRSPFLDQSTKSPRTITKSNGLSQITAFIHQLTFIVSKSANISRNRLSRCSGLKPLTMQHSSG